MTGDADEATLAGWLREAERVLAFVGAGVSAESGVPTFRGAGGLWEGHRVEDVATPEAFARDPLVVWRFYAARMEQLLAVRPNPAHAVLAELERLPGDFLLVTQNVDDLHERAGSTRMVKLHGSVMETRCTGCARVAPADAPALIAQTAAGALPLCGCGGVLRPNVVWFGEYLNPEHFGRIHAFFRRGCGADSGGRPPLVLIAGTSGVVGGGYGLIELARACRARIVEINPEASTFSGSSDLVLRAPAGEVLARVRAAL